MNKQAESTLPFVLEEIDRLPGFYHLPLVSPCPEFQGESSQGRKEAVSVVHTHTHTHTRALQKGGREVGEGERGKGTPLKEGREVIQIVFKM